MDTKTKLAETTELFGRTARLNSFVASEVLTDKDRANAYVWGFQDGAKESLSCIEAWNFMAAYWEYSLEFAEEKRASKMNIPDAFRSWRATGEIKRD